jgi:hypothetical protein
VQSRFLGFLLSDAASGAKGDRNDRQQDEEVSCHGVES